MGWDSSLAVPAQERMFLRRHCWFSDSQPGTSSHSFIHSFTCSVKAILCLLESGGRMVNTTASGIQGEID